MKKNSTIVFGVRWGGFVRMLVDGGVIQRLTEMGARVVFATPAGAAAALAADVRLGAVTIWPLETKASRLATVLDKIRVFLFPTLLPTSTSRAIADQLKATRPIQYRILALLDGRPLQLLFAAWRWWHRRLVTDWMNEAAFRAWKPDLVVVPSLGRGAESYNILRFAERMGTPTLGAMSSWDVLTTKEYPLEAPQRLIVWNEPNRRQACEVFGYRHDDVYVSGPPHFDLYSEAKCFPDAREHFEALGLEVERALLLVTGQPGIPKEDVEQGLRTLAELVEGNHLTKQCQVLFRPHPMTFLDGTGGFGTESDLRLCEGLGRHFRVSRPIRSPGGLDINIDADDARMLMASLSHAAILLDYFGTLSAEACVLDKPQIYMGLGESPGRVGLLPMHRRAGYTHVKLLLDSGAGWLVRTKEELREAIDVYLLDPTRDSEGRRIAAESIAYTRDGRAGVRMSRAIYGFAGGLWPPEGDGR